MRVSKTYMIVWTTLVGIALMTLVALGIRERHSAATLHQLGPAQIDWTAAGGPKGAESLKLPGGPKPLRFITWGISSSSAANCSLTADLAEKHVAKRFANASARRMHLSKKKGHEFLLGDSAKILQFYTNITHPTQNKLAQIDWKPLGKTPTQSLEKVLERSQEKAKGDSCYFLVVDEVNILQASIRIPSDTPNFDEKLIQRAISRSVHQWSTFRFLADVPMLRKQLTDPTYRRQNKLN